ncbi:DUF805 domain-containing protein [Pedobacter sp. KBW01]|uniref:DUF805 domain-containing protein n=1 Tax=Pedobacter sp. KBW01 TaxID=2153364 RepID=UPI000F59823D|nr:DUF805 domain-containing protein [Pedobacter sp. KBW01]RQO73690.1 DUF805 domain-containing protein [Pedobacter sp. KBW01]
MFKSVFSFEGRIRRTEYGLTRIFAFLVILLIAALAESDGAEAFGLLMLLPIYIMITQGAKRCHDLGNSGWWMLIPFYGLIMLFGSGDYGPNEYGDNPKGEGNDDPYYGTDFQQKASVLPVATNQYPAGEDNGNTVGRDL